MRKSLRRPQDTPDLVEAIVWPLLCNGNPPLPKIKACSSIGPEAMALTFSPTGPSFCAEVAGVDFSRPVDAATFAQIVAGMDQYGVCVFRATGLDDVRHIEFSRL